ncbi:MAG: methylated-DNA--[protein]-cysteine S-methyltransferase [Pseudomonadales bacterium]
MNLRADCDDYRRIEAALDFLQTHRREQPDLPTLAHELGLSEFQTQRLFTRWAGVSPKRFLQFLGKQHARQLLLEQRPILEVADELGLSGGGRLHDLVVNTWAVTPGELARSGSGLQIRYGFPPTPFGECLLGFTPRGICHLAFAHEHDHDAMLQALRAEWPNASLAAHEHESAALAGRIFGGLPSDGKPLALLLRGTNFQLQVWEALLRIPEGRLCTYGDIATAIGKPRAARAVGQAVGRNAIAYLVPCHRVIRGMGEFGGYRWGRTRKLAMLGREAAALSPETADPRACQLPPRSA